VFHGRSERLDGSLTKLPENFPSPIVMFNTCAVIHQTFAERLPSKMPIPRARSGRRRVLDLDGVLAPGNYHMALNATRRGRFGRPSPGPPENACRPSVDVLFRSVTEIYEAAALAVIMRMAKTDYADAVSCNKRAARSSCRMKHERCWGMPGAVVRESCG